MSKRFRWIAAAAIVGLIVLLIYFSRQATGNKLEVCVSFHGRSHCATAAGATRTDAIRSAQEIDCTLLTGNREENMVCLASAPDSVRDVK